MSDVEQSAGKRSAWMAHVKKTMRAHKGKSLKAVLKIAGKTYKKTGGALSPLPLTTGGRRRTVRKTRSKH